MKWAKKWWWLVALGLAVALVIGWEEKRCQSEAYRCKASYAAQAQSDRLSGNISINQQVFEQQAIAAACAPNSYFCRLFDAANLPTMLLVFIGIAGIWAALWTLHAIQRQADLMERQTVATEIAAQASAKSAEVARDTLYLTQAADVHIEGVKIYPPKSPLNGNTVITVTVKNHGQTKAKKVTNNLTLGVKGQLTRPDEPRVDIEVEIGAGQPFEIGFDPLGKNLGPEVLARILRGEILLQFWGIIRYRDVFGRGYVIDCEGTYNHLGSGFYVDRNEHREE